MLGRYGAIKGFITRYTRELAVAREELDKAQNGTLRSSSIDLYRWRVEKLERQLADMKRRLDREVTRLGSYAPKEVT